MKMIFTGKVSGEKTVLAAGARHTVKAQAGERKRKLTAVCSHQARIGNLDAHLI
ncbi:hypothetical protein ODW01_22855 [Escherichia coli]|nr:hypothetical protein [Escherichia coli]